MGNLSNLGLWLMAYGLCCFHGTGPPESWRRPCSTQIPTQENKARGRDQELEKPKLGWILQAMLQGNRNYGSHLRMWEDQSLPGHTQPQYRTTQNLQPQEPVRRSWSMVWSQKRNQILAQFAAASFVIAEIMKGRLTGDKLSWRRTKFKLVAYVSNLLGSNNV